MVVLVSNQQCPQNMLMNNVRKIGKQMFRKFLAIGYHTGTVILHTILSLFYYGKRKVVPPIKNDLLLKSATKLAAEVREGKVKCESIINAYIERIKEVEPYINATTYQCFTEAIKEARQVDKLIESGEMNQSQLAQEKPFLGIPISVKLLLKINGLPHTGGSVDSKYIIATEDADAIKYMKKAGAIVLAQTNAPEKGVSIETFNKLYGRTNNPYDTSRSPGGSTGGEGALIGAGASLLGIGNDTAGSLRIPALFCGIYGHKPSSGLVSPHGQFACIDEVTTIGPMCRYAEDLVMAMKVLTMDKQNVIKEMKVNFKNIKIFYVMSMENAFNLPLDIELKEAFEKVLQYFEKTYCIKAKKVETLLLKKIEDILRHIIINEVGDVDTLKERLKIPNETAPNAELVKFLLGISKYTMTVPFLLKLLKFPLWYNESNVPYYKELFKQLDQEFIELLDDNSIFLCPTLPKTALHHGETLYMATNLCYVGIWNFLKLPATHCPLGLNKQGLPLGIQVICSKNNDTLNLAVASELEKAFGGWVPPKYKY